MSQGLGIFFSLYFLLSIIAFCLLQKSLRRHFGHNHNNVHYLKNNFYCTVIKFDKTTIHKLLYLHYKVPMSLCVNLHISSIYLLPCGAQINVIVSIGKI